MTPWALINRPFLMKNVNGQLNLCFVPQHSAFWLNGGMKGGKKQFGQEFPTFVYL